MKENVSGCFFLNTVYVIHIGKFFLSWQVNYNQVVVKCQVLQECFLQKCNMQKFQNMEHSNSRTFQGLSRAWNFFFQNSRTFKDFSRTLWTLWITDVSIVACLANPTEVTDRQTDRQTGKSLSVCSVNLISVKQSNTLIRVVSKQQHVL